MTRLRYGPRWRSSAKSVGAAYDGRLHKGMINPAFLNMSAEQRHTSQLKAQISVANKGYDKMGRGRKKITITLAGQAVTPKAIDESEWFGERFEKVINFMIDALCLNLEMIWELPENSRDFPFPPHLVLDAVHKLCVAVRRPLPTFRNYRQPGRTHASNRCVNCGCWLSGSWVSSRLCRSCLEIEADPDGLRELRERREQRTVDFEELRTLLKEIEDAKHRRYSRKNAEIMEAGGRKENFRNGGKVKDFHRTGDLGDPKG